MKYLLITFIAILSFTVNAQLAITIPGEFEKNDKVMFTWSYSSEIDSIIGEIVNIAKTAVVVEIIYNPDSIQYDTTQIRSFLADVGVDNYNVNFVPAYTNTCWMRQYSPVTGYGVFDEDLVQYFGNPKFVDYNQQANDSVPSQLANYWDLNFVNYAVKFENSNIQYDGLYNLFVGEKIIDQNLPLTENEIKFNLNAYFGSDDVYFTPSLTQSGGGELLGNNMYMKMLDFETVLVSSIPDSLPDYQILEDFVDELSAIPTKFGGQYKVIRVMSPPNADGKYPTTQFEEMRTYTNMLIINNLLIIPSYGLPEFDSAAYYTYKKYMDGYEIYMVDAQKLSVSYGGIGLLAKEIPQPNFLRIIHKKKIGPQIYSPDIEILCLASSNAQIEEMWLYYKINSETDYTKKEIHLVCPQHFAVITDLLPTDTVHYYIEAISSATTVTYPLSAPNGSFSFWFDIVDVNQNSSNNFDVRIAPNPAVGSFKILSNKLNEEIQLSFYNMLGSLVWVTNAHTGSSINTNILPQGSYIVVVNNHGDISKLKLEIIK